MARTCCEAEGSRNYNLLHQSIRNTIVMKYGKLSVGESIASSAVKTSIDVGAKVIVVLSDSGKMANYVAKFRPAIPVLMVTPSLVAARQASGLLLGMHTIVVDTLQKTESLLDELMHELTHAGLSEGETVCVIAGRMAQMKEQLQVFTVGSKEMHSPHGHIVSQKQNGLVPLFHVRVSLCLPLIAAKWWRVLLFSRSVAVILGLISYEK